MNNLEKKDELKNIIVGIEEISIINQIVETKKTENKNILPKATIKKAESLPDKSILKHFEKPTGFDYMIEIQNSENKGLLDGQDSLKPISEVIQDEFIKHKEIFFKHPNRNLYDPIVVSYADKGLEDDSTTLSYMGYYIIPCIKTSDKEQSDLEFKIYLKNKWNGTDFTPEFLIDYTLKSQRKELEEVCDGGKPTKEEIMNHTCLKLYRICFHIDFPVCPKTVTTYLWQEDPVGSRGTVTTVQPPVITSSTNSDGN